MAEQISDERQDFLMHLANDTWVDELDGVGDAEFDELTQDWLLRTADFLETSTDARELYFFAENYNWGKGWVLLDLLITNPALDRAGAHLLFWAAQPEYYQEYGSVAEVPDYQVDGWDFVQRLLARIADGRYDTVLNEFDPDDWMSEDVNASDSKWLIPQELLEPVAP